MKKIVCILCCIVLVASMAALFVGCNNVPRENTLKLYVPGEYIDEDIFEDFEKWYEETYQIKVKVKCETFEAVEDIKLALKSKADYDLLCPSDYMIKYLIDNRLLQKVDKSMIDISQEGKFKDAYIEMTKDFDKDLSYSVPYMYGTLGIVYDYSKTNEMITSWEALYGSKYAGKRSFKDTEHELYATLCIYNARNDSDAVATLTGDAQKAKIQSIFDDTSDATIAAAKAAFNATTGDIWDVDTVKFDMASNAKGSPAVAMMYSCDAGYVMNEYEGNDGKMHDGNHNLWYVVPAEGGNVYLDSFVISTYAVNTHAANAFLQYISTPEIALRNSEYAGAISPVSETYDELYAYYTDPACDLFSQADVDSGWKQMFVETMFPTQEILDRCGMMKDFGSQQDKITTMIKNLN